MSAITLYLKNDIIKALEREREKRHLDSKPQAASRIIENYFRERGMLSEEED